jgi:hypothetical protein
MRRRSSRSSIEPERRWQRSRPPSRPDPRSDHERRPKAWTDLVSSPAPRPHSERDRWTPGNRWNAPDALPSRRRGAAGRCARGGLGQNAPAPRHFGPLGVRAPFRLDCCYVAPDWRSRTDHESAGERKGQTAATWGATVARCSCNAIQSRAKLGMSSRRPPRTKIRALEFIGRGSADGSRPASRSSALAQARTVQRTDRRTTGCHRREGPARGGSGSPRAASPEDTGA